MMTIDWRYPVFGVLLGLALQCAGLTDPDHVRNAAALKSWQGVRVLLYTLGLGMGLMALLCWLAVIDVDLIRVAPLHAGTLLGAVLFGAALGLCGAAPATLLAGVGGGRLAESLCGAAGCAAGVWLADLVPAAALSGVFSQADGTLFRLTLTDPYLLGGGDAALACTGAVLCVLALFARKPQPTGPAPEKAVPQPETSGTDGERPAEEDAPENEG